ncbi:MAG: flagellar hook-associated protein FlgK [Rickettsiales bacterium]
MSLGIALNNALSGLRINQQSIAVLSQNIANVNTSGYSRQVISQSAITVAGIGSGVQIDEITRKIDKYLQRSTQSQSSSNSTSQSINDYYQRLQALLGQPGSGNSLDVFLTGFFNSVQQLAETPETNSLKGNAVASASALAKQVSDLATNIHDLRYETDREIADAVSSVNSSLDRLKSINDALVQAKSLGQSTAGLLDSRDKELRTLSGYMNISVTSSDSGSVSVVGGDGAVLVEEGIRHQLRYSKAQSLSIFVNDAPFSSLDVLALNELGQEVGNSTNLISGGTSSQVKSNVSGGLLAGLQQMRDQKFPAILEQLDELASRIRDGVNAVHNKGSSYPPALQLTGDRSVKSRDQYSWQGTVRIAVLQADGSPVPSSYADEAYTGLRPLTLDLGKLDSGQGNGKPTLQTIVDEINNHFGSPGRKVVLGNLNNIQMASDTDILPSGAPSLFDFDLDLENISTGNARVFVTGMTVLDDTAANITNVSRTAPSISISGSNSYSTTIGLPDVTINMTTPPNVAVGEIIYLNSPSAPVNGISQANLTGFFTVTAVSGNTITFTAAASATSTGSVNDAGNIQAMKAYDTVAPGEQARTRDNGQLQVNLSANPSSAYYDITVDVTVIQDDGTLSTAPITYRVNNNVRDAYNTRYDVQAAGAPATIVLPGTSQQSLRAILVDDKGNELPTVNGKYIDAPSFLKIVSGNASYGVAIDEMDSSQLGKPDGSPAELGTNWGFSHYFGLNNFFESNEPTLTGDTRRNSAYNLKVQDRFVADATLISTGNLTKVATSLSSNNREVYSYARYAGDNATAQLMSALNTTVLSFDAAGGLPRADQSLQGYTSGMLGFVSQRSAEASDNAVNAKTLYEGFKNKSDAVSGVNLDEELANTVTFQNAYSATARVVTIVNKMYEDLLSSV